MSKVLIDRALLETLLVQHVAELGYTNTTAHHAQKVLAAPSGTPAMPVKAYYHEWTDLEGVRTRSVGLEVRKAFTDAPLVLEADALARVACLEGEIAKRDARIMGLESRYQRDVYGLNNEGDPIGGDPAGGYANDNARLRTELAALKAQGVVQWPEADEIMQMAFEEGQPADDASGYCFELEEFDLFIERLMSEVARLSAAPVRQPKCKTCDDNGRIGGPSFYAPDEGGEPCPDCCAPVQQVVPDEREDFEKWGETLFYTACFERHENDEYVGRGLQGAWLGWKARAALNAAPAADAWIPVSERLPIVAAGKAIEVIVAVKRKHNGQVYVFTTEYLNCVQVNQDGQFVQDDDNDNAAITGWFYLSDDEETWHRTLGDGDELLAWQYKPAYAAHRAKGVV